MTCRARYRGLHPVFGVDKNNTYTLEMRTHSSEHGEPYLWVRIQELPEYLMPYESMMAILTEWDFTVDDKASYVEHLNLMDAWMDIYTPSEVVKE